MKIQVNGCLIPTLAAAQIVLLVLKLTEAMYRFAESNCTGIELRCRIDLRPSLQGAEFNMYNFSVIIGDGLKND